MNYYTIENLSVYYDNNCILNNLDLKINEGELIVIVGKSGCGKTTFLKALANFIPYTGKINISKKIGMVFQQYAIFPWMTISENIMFGIGNHKKNDKNRIVNDLLMKIGLTEKQKQYPAKLSSGQIQRVALARSIARNPDILLMDEPFGALDYFTRVKMQQWLLDLWSQYKITIILVTHDIEEAIFLADRIIVLNKNQFTKNIKIPFPRPRLINIKFTNEFNQIKQELFNS